MTADAAQGNTQASSAQKPARIVLLESIPMQTPRCVKSAPQARPIPRVELQNPGVLNATEGNIQMQAEQAVRIVLLENFQISQKQNPKPRVYNAVQTHSRHHPVLRRAYHACIRSTCRVILHIVFAELLT